VTGFRIKITAAALLAAVVFAGCSTVNRLNEYDIYGASIAMDMMIPPEPSVDVDYGNVDFGGDKLLAAVQLGTNLIKAGQADNAEKKLKRALEGLYIPEYAAELTFDRIVKMLDGKMLSNMKGADLILEIDIDKYGLEAYSFGGNVSMVFSMTARFYHGYDNTLIWQRHVSVKKEITPAIFGFDQVIGNVVSIASLGSLSEEQLAEGFQRMTHEIMQETVNYLKEDLRKAAEK